MINISTLTSKIKSYVKPFSVGLYISLYYVIPPTLWLFFVLLWSNAKIKKKSQSSLLFFQIWYFLAWFRAEMRAEAKSGLIILSFKFR